MTRHRRSQRPAFEPLEARTFLTTWYVSTGGSELTGDGTESNPWRSLQRAADTVVAGDLVNVLPGTYTEKVSVTRSGSVNAPIVFRAYGGDVTVTSPSVAQWSAVIDLRGNHITFDGIDVRDSAWYGYKIEGASNTNRATGVTITNAHTLRTNASGIFVARSAQVLLLKNKVQDACISTVPGQNVHESITIAETDGFELAETEVWNSVGHNGPANGGEGIDAKGSARNGLIRDNFVHDLSRLGIYLDSGSKQGAGATDDNPMSNIVVTRNVVRNCADGIVVSSELGGTAEKITISNNLVYDNKANGITVTDWVANGPRADIVIANNTVTRNGFTNNQATWGGGIDIATTNYTNIRIVNNVVSHNESWQIARTRSATEPVGQLTVSGNLSFGNALSYWNPMVGTPGLNVDPKYINAAAADFRLQRTSPAINFATAPGAPAVDLLGRTRTGIADAGAYEYQPPTLSSVVSRKSHGAAGTFNLALAIGGMSPTIEPRLGGANQLVFTFSNSIKAVDGLLSANEFTITNATFSSATISGSTLTLNLSNVVDRQYAVISLKGLADVSGNALDPLATLTVGNLLGDVNGNRSVTGSDQLIVKRQLVQALDATNFLADLNCSGTVTGSDQLLLKSKLLSTLP